MLAAPGAALLDREQTEIDLDESARLRALRLRELLPRSSPRLHFLHLHHLITRG
jgi:hypothetical protein